MKYKLMAVLTLVTMLTAGALFPSENADADSEDIKVYYAYTLHFSFNGEAAEGIRWDFGDGTPEVENAWNVEHTYQERGVYVITQTVWNNIDEDVATITVRIMGHPTVTFHTGTGGFRNSIEVPLIGEDAQVLPDVGIPEKTGFTFKGWYYDEGRTLAWSPDDVIGEHIDLYAEWELDSMVVYISIGGASLVAALLIILILARRRAGKD